MEDTEQKLRQSIDKVLKKYPTRSLLICNTLKQLNKEDIPRLKHGDAERHPQLESFLEQAIDETFSKFHLTPNPEKFFEQNDAKFTTEEQNNLNYLGEKIHDRMMSATEDSITYSDFFWTIESSPLLCKDLIQRIPDTELTKHNVVKSFYIYYCEIESLEKEQNPHWVSPSSPEKEPNEQQEAIKNSREKDSGR